MLTVDAVIKISGFCVSERVSYFDILRAIAIIGVVAIHASGTGLQFDAESMNFHFTFLWRNLLNFSVPLFLAISGFFLVKKQFSGLSDYTSFLKKQVPRVYIPVFIWSLVWLAISVVIYKQAVSDEVIKLLTFQSSGPYYFIALIIQFYILLPVMGRLANPRGLILSVIVSILLTGLIYYLRYFMNVSMPFIVYAGNFMTWMMFFVLGMYLGKVSRIKISNPILLALTMVFYGLSCVESYLLFYTFDQAGNAVTAVKASSFLYSFFMILLLFKNQNWIQSAILKKLGEMSFGIYLVHMFFLQAAVMVTTRLYSPLQDMSVLYQFSLVMLVLTSCGFCIFVSRYVLTTKHNRLIGFN